jgi:membrane associated rhomboid family serine protease
MIRALHDADADAGQFQGRESRARRIVQRSGSAERLGDQRLATYYEQAILDAYRSFRAGAPSNLTTRLAYAPDSWNPLRMLSAAVAHASWSHVIGNLIFFYAFAATIEILLGPALYLAVLLVLALGTHTVYSLAMMNNPAALPTVGLSGVVMGMIALFVYFIPHARISCFLWLIFFYRRFALPAWLLASWYIGWGSLHDVHEGRKHRGQSHRPPVGAALGLAIGAILLSRQAPLGAGSSSRKNELGSGGLQRHRTVVGMTQRALAEARDAEARSTRRIERGDVAVGRHPVVRMRRALLRGRKGSTAIIA